MLYMIVITVIMIILLQPLDLRAAEKEIPSVHREKIWKGYWSRRQKLSSEGAAQITQEQLCFKQTLSALTGWGAGGEELICGGPEIILRCGSRQRNPSLAESALKPCAVQARFILCFLTELHS